MYVVDILTTIEEYVDSCFYSNKPPRVCIVYDCIPGPLNTLMDNTALTKARGSLFQAVLHHGFLRCSFFGHITNITVPKSASEISIRDENGTEILCYTYGHFCTDYNDKWYSCDSQNFIFSLTKEVKMNAIEMTVLTTDVFDITLGVEGGEYYKCQSDINYKQELEDELSATKGLNRSCTDGSNFKEQLHLTATILSTLLSLVLTGVILYLLQRKNKLNLIPVPGVH
uniref:Uncharacterized protein LOC111138279 isoform X2 n=1 Tax=Crassostrea virginica TaxID=6565 RepID=A0A8B8F217_CRAVI|nr:uncharacterized protein LOC111138279 isoform X2 [Crassostrea virginica]